MDQMNKPSDGLLIELIRLNILREKKSDFKFRFSFEKFSKKETYSEVQIIYGINNLDLFKMLDHENFIAFCNENNIRFEKHIFSEHIGPILVCKLHNPQLDTIEKLLDQLVMYYKKMPNRPSNISSVIDHYNIRTYVSNNDDIINTYSIQGFK